MKLVPYTIMVPAHYRTFIRELEAIMPGEMHKWMTNIVTQIAEDINPQGSFDELFVDAADWSHLDLWKAHCAVNCLMRADAAAKALDKVAA